MRERALASIASYGWHEWLCHSNFSFLAGASHPGEYVDRALALGYRGLAMTDYDGVYGLARTHLHLKRLRKHEEATHGCHAFHLTHGLELRLAKDHELPLVYQDTVVLVAQSRQGYRHLCELGSYAHRDGKTNAWVPLEALLDHAADGLIAIQPMRGVIRRGGDPEVYAQRCALLAEKFGSRFHFAVSRHLNPSEDVWIAPTLALAKRLGRRCLLSQDAFFHEPAQKDMSDLLHAVRTNLTMDEAVPHLFANAERCLHSLDGLARRFGALPIYEEALRASRELAESCVFDMAELKYNYPQEMIPDGMTPHDFLASLTWESARKLFGDPIPERLVKTLAHELALIKQLEFEKYFLTVRDIVHWARGRGILCQGRGSAANSAVCYVLGVTAVDPASFDLLFERFVSVERGDPPDIDVDFEHERREEVIQYIYERFGRPRAAMVANVITFQSRGALRAVGKALGMPETMLGEVAHTLEARFFRQSGMQKVLEHVRGETDDEETDDDQAVPRQTPGAPRQAGARSAPDLGPPPGSQRQGARETRGGPGPRGERRADPRHDQGGHAHGLPRDDRPPHGSRSSARHPADAGGDDARAGRLSQAGGGGDAGGGDDARAGRLTVVSRARPGVGANVKANGGSPHGTRDCGKVPRNAWRETPSLRGPGPGPGERSRSTTGATPTSRSTSTSASTSAPVARAVERSSGGDDVRAYVRATHGESEEPEPPWELWATLAERLRGFPRHLGLHSGGFMLSDQPLDALVSQEPATMEGRSVIQWCKEDIEGLGFFKIDVLALGMLTAIRKCLDEVERHYGTRLELRTIPHQDEPTYEMIRRADTVGTFQIESRAQMSMLPRLRPENFYDLVVEVAIVRPGPIQGGMIHPYLQRRRDRALVTYPDERLRPILTRTLGIPIFQEQVMRIAMAVGDFTAGEANELRRHMGAFSMKGNLGPWLGRMADGMRRNGLDEEFVQSILRQMHGFADYGFPESHAVSFALLAYASAFLKCHYPDAFFASILNSQPMGFYSPHALLQGAKRDGVEILPVCAQRSHWDTTLEEISGGTRERRYALRLGLRFVGGMRQAGGEELLRARSEAGGAFTSLDDVLRRARLFRNDLTALAAADAFHLFGLQRKAAIWLAEAAPFCPTIEDVEAPVAWPAESTMERAESDFASTGTTLGPHPTAIIRRELWCYDVPLQSVRFAESLAKVAPGQLVRVFGMVLVRQSPPTAKGMVFLTLEDETGFLNLILTPQVYARVYELIERQAFLCVSGRLQRAGEAHSVRVENVFAPRVARADVIPMDTSRPVTAQELVPTRNYM